MGGCSLVLEAREVVVLLVLPFGDCCQPVREWVEPPGQYGHAARQESPYSTPDRVDQEVGGAERRIGGCVPSHHLIVPDQTTRRTVAVVKCRLGVACHFSP